MYMGYLYIAGFVLLVLYLQNPDRGNNSNEEQKDRRGKPTRQPKAFKNVLRKEKKSDKHVYFKHAGRLKRLT